MNARILGTFSALRPYRMNLLVFGCLLSLGVWGHHTKWKLGAHEESHEAAVADAAKTEDLGDVKTSASGAEGDTKSLAAPAISKSNTAEHAIEVRFNSPEAVRRSGIKLAKVARQSMNQEVVANGVLVYDQTRVAQLSTRAGGTVWRVEKQVGQPIRKGDVLAIVEAVEVGTAKADFLQALVVCELKDKIMARFRSLGQVLSERQIQEAETAQREARIKLASAQQTLVNLGLPVRSEDVAGLPEKELTERIQFLGLPESLVKELDPRTTTANLIPLLAPFDGIVIGHDVTIGEAVTPTNPQFIIADTSRMWVLLDVHKEDAARLTLGQSVEFQCDGNSGVAQSTINWISTEVDPKTRTLRVRAEVENPLIADGTDEANGPRQLRANSFGTGRIRIREQPQVTVVPNEALQWEGTRHLVFVRCDPAAFEAREVKPGISGEHYTEIISGLSAGETVASQGSHVLKSEILRTRLTAGIP